MSRIAVLLLLVVAPALSAQPPARVDRFGDPLPAGAIARLGTTRFRHGEYIGSMAISPDSKQIAVAAAGKNIVVWDAATGKRLHLFTGHTEGVLDVTYTADGS